MEAFGFPRLTLILVYFGFPTQGGVFVATISGWRKIFESLLQVRVEIFISGIPHWIMGGERLPLKPLNKPATEYL